MTACAVSTSGASAFRDNAECDQERPLVVLDLALLLAAQFLVVAGLLALVLVRLLEGHVSTLPFLPMRIAKRLAGVSVKNSAAKSHRQK